MKRYFLIPAVAIAFLAAPSVTASAQINLGRALSGAVKAVQAISVTDAQMAEYVQASVRQMDAENKVAPANSPYTQRLNRLTAGITQADGIPLNFKVYVTDDINAFACPDGSVRVYTGIMDMMDDDELLGIIGHEIGHVMKHHSRNAFRQTLINGALKDVIASTGGMAAALTDSQLGALGNSLANASYSKKQEKEADNCGYDFLVANGRNPWGMVTAFEKMLALEQSGGSQQSYVAKMFSDHPDTKSRIKAMTKRCEKDKIPRPVK
ncbi:MAG: M48 family metallopeptidase [Muribaculaceae bacterium]|nr:M48 family metallopeptidase [Muribaculaceae bacterium]